MATKTDLRDVLRKLRIEKDWSQQRMADFLKVSRLTVARWETKVMGMSARTEHRVRKAVGFTAGGE